MDERKRGGDALPETSERPCRGCEGALPPEAGFKRKYCDHCRRTRKRRYKRSSSEKEKRYQRDYKRRKSRPEWTSEDWHAYEQRRAERKTDRQQPHLPALRRCRECEHVLPEGTRYQRRYCDQCLSEHKRHQKIAHAATEKRYQRDYKRRMRHPEWTPEQWAVYAQHHTELNAYREHRRPPLPDPSVISTPPLSPE